MIACISLLTPQYRASEALVLPVDAQAARRAPIMWACVNAAVMPLSLKLPDGFIPSYCRYKSPAFRPTNRPTPSQACSSVCPSPMVTIFSAGANGNSSRNRHTPLKQSGSFRRLHFCFERRERLGNRQRVPVVLDVQQRTASVATSLHLRRRHTSRAQLGWMQRW